jgi:uncharacterized membrane protein YbhN (UPF0104 family)
LGVTIAFAYYLYNNSDKYLELLNISKTRVFFLFLLSLAFPLLNGMQNTYLFRGMGLIEFSHWDGYLITAASTLANQLPIPGGIVSRGYYLKYRHNLSYTKYASSTVALFFCYLAINGMIGILVLLYWSLIRGTTIPSILFIAFAAMVSCILVFWLPLERIRMPEKIYYWTSQAVDGWTAIGRNPGLLFKLTFLQALLVILLSFRYWIVFHMLSQNISFGQTLLFASVSILTQLVSIAPGGLGIRETIVAAVASVLGFDAAISMVAVGIDRLVATVMIVLTGGSSMVILGKQISTVPHEPA